MKIIYNKIIPVKGFTAINVLGIVFARKEYYPISTKTINHEAIHTAQIKEMLFVFFYLWYIIEWLMRWFYYGFDSDKAYRKLLFEREAYENDLSPDYLKNRKLFSWLRY